MTYKVGQEVEIQAMLYKGLRGVITFIHPSRNINDCLVVFQSEDKKYESNYFDKVFLKPIYRETFTKDDLKIGMVCKLRDGYETIVCNDFLQYIDNKYDYIALICFDNNLKYENRKNLDVMEVYQHHNGPLLWKRPEEIEVLTLEELAKLAGKDINKIKIKENI